MNIPYTITYTVVLIVNEVTAVHPEGKSQKIWPKKRFTELTYERSRTPTVYRVHSLFNFSKTKKNFYPTGIWKCKSQAFINKKEMGLTLKKIKEIFNSKKIRVKIQDFPKTG